MRMTPLYTQARTQGVWGVTPPETAGIDFHSGFRKKIIKVGANRNPKKIQVYTFIVASGENDHGEGGGGGANQNHIKMQV